MSNNIKNDKFYTPIKVANHCWDKVDEIIGLNNIDYIIEPSVGNGSFCQYEKRKPNLCIDIEPEIESTNDYKVIKEDFLKSIIIYKPNSLIIGNFPYGNRNYLAQQFFNKSIHIADYVACILPINQLNNSYSFKGGTLLYSEDLGDKEYSGISLHCCFNIYESQLNHKSKNDKIEEENDKIESSDIKIIRHDENVKLYLSSEDVLLVNSVAGGKHNLNYTMLQDYDLRFVYFGSGCCGKVFDKNEESKTYAGEYKIKIDDRNKDKQAIIDFIKSYDWNGNCKSISMKRISKQDILHELNKRFDINQTKNKTLF